MEFCGFETKTVTYPDPAPGWIDGVYHEREARTAPGGEHVYVSRRFREREETGWGVYDYVEGTRFSFPAEYGDWRITVRIRAEEGCKLDVFCDGVCVFSGAEATPDGAELSFTVRSCGETSELAFAPAADGDAGSSASLAVTEISRERVPVPEAKKIPTLFLASDSTVQTYDQYYYPQTGWGEVLYRFFTDAELVREYRPDGSTYSHCRAYGLPGVVIENRAIGGRSARSFYLEGKLSELLSRAARGDFIMIQFGHNDCTKARPNRYSDPDGYKSYIRRYVKSALSRGILPILVTPVSRRNCGEDGVFAPSFAEYSEKLSELSSEFDVPLIDLGSASLEILNTLGADDSKRLYLHTEPGQHEGAYIGGAADNTHLSRTGALIYAGRVADMLSRSADERLAALGGLVDRNRIDYITEALLGKRL